MSVKKQVRNRHTGAAGITAREATRLKKAAQMIYKLSQKKNLYIKTENELLQVSDLLFEILQDNDRI